MWAMGQIYLDTGKGKGMVRAFIFKGGLKCGPAKAGVKIVVKKAVSFGAPELPIHRRPRPITARHIVAEFGEHCADLLPDHVSARAQSPPFAFGSGPLSRTSSNNHPPPTPATGPRRCVDW
jgi:hypothetical protein